MAWQLHSREENKFGEKFAVAETSATLAAGGGERVDVAMERLGNTKVCKRFLRMKCSMGEKMDEKNFL
jgi:hypothetical protein